MNQKVSKSNPKRNSNQKPKTYSGVVKHPGTGRITGRVYFKEDESLNSLKYGTIILIAVMAALAATLSPIGNAIVDGLGFSGMSAADIWWALVAIAAIVGFILALADWSSRWKI